MERQNFMNKEPEKEFYFIYYGDGSFNLVSAIGQKGGYVYYLIESKKGNIFCAGEDGGQVGKRSFGLGIAETQVDFHQIIVEIMALGQIKMDGFGTVVLTGGNIGFFFPLGHDFVPGTFARFQFAVRIQFAPFTGHVVGAHDIINTVAEKFFVFGQSSAAGKFHIVGMGENGHYAF